MKEQLAVEDLSQAVEVEKEEKIKELEEQLSQAQDAVTSNKAASDILHDLISKGEVVMGPNGSVQVVHGPNTIGNEHELME